jgi:hypothetical protein
MNYEWDNVAIACASEALTAAGVENGIVKGERDADHKPNNVFIDGCCWIHVVDGHYKVIWAAGLNRPKQTYEIADPTCLEQLVKFVRWHLRVVHFRASVVLALEALMTLGIIAMLAFIMYSLL